MAGSASRQQTQHHEHINSIRVSCVKRRNSAERKKVQQGSHSLSVVEWQKKETTANNRGDGIPFKKSSYSMVSSRPSSVSRPTMLLLRPGKRRNWLRIFYARQTRANNIQPGYVRRQKTSRTRVERTRKTNLFQSQLKGHVRPIHIGQKIFLLGLSLKHTLETTTNNTRGKGTRSNITPRQGREKGGE